MTRYINQSLGLITILLRGVAKEAIGRQAALRMTVSIPTMGDTHRGLAVMDMFRGVMRKVIVVGLALFFGYRVLM